MFGKTVTLFRIFGFEVKVDWSWLILGALIVWSLATGLFPTWYKGLDPADYWVMGVAGALGLFLSIIFHELWHSLVARRYGVEMRGITLFLFGGVSEMGDEPASPKAGVLPSHSRADLERRAGRGPSWVELSPGRLGTHDPGHRRPQLPRLPELRPGGIQPHPRLSPGRRPRPEGRALGDLE